MLAIWADGRGAMGQTCASLRADETGTGTWTYTYSSIAQNEVDDDDELVGIKEETEPRSREIAV